MNDLPEVVKVRKGFYRVGALTVQKWHMWCVFHDEKALPQARFTTRAQATWWAQHNQPKESA